MEQFHEGVTGSMIFSDNTVIVFRTLGYNAGASPHAMPRVRM